MNLCPSVPVSAGCFENVTDVVVQKALNPLVDGRGFVELSDYGVDEGKMSVGEDYYAVEEELVFWVVLEAVVRSGMF